MNHLLSGRMRCWAWGVLSVVCLCGATPALGQGMTTDAEILDVFTPVVEPVRPSVMQIIVDGKEMSLGTVVDAAGLILTKASEILEADTLVCIAYDGTEYEASVVSIDNASDLALLHVDTTDLTPVVFVATEALEIGQWVIVPGLDESPLSAGIVSAQRRPIPGRRLVLGVMLSAHPKGLQVDELTRGYGAADAGIEVGDVILEVSGQAVAAIQEVVRELRDLAAGDSVSVLLEREGHEMEIEVEVREMQPDPRNRTERMNQMGGAVSDRHAGFAAVFQHDAFLRPKDCGGPLVNLAGEVVGINIARAGRIASYALPADLVLERLESLRAELQVPVELEPDEEG